MPEAVWKNRRRLTPCLRASDDPRSNNRASTLRCCSLCGVGKYSSLEMICVGIGVGSAASSATDNSFMSSGPMKRIGQPPVYVRSMVNPVSVAAQLARETKKVGLIPVLDELAIGNPPDFDATPGKFLSRRLKHRGIRDKLNRMICGRRECYARHHFVSIDDQIGDLTTT